MKNQYGRIPKVIRSDRGGEYLDKDLVEFFKLNGIKRQLTVSNTPQQNGCAERKNRTLIEMVRCMLSNANLHKQYWGEAVTMANHIQNRLPVNFSNTTPYELWYGQKPNLSYLHQFGSKVYSHIMKNNRKKLDNTAEKLIFVGYESGTKGYRLLNIRNNSIKISRDVKFLTNDDEEVEISLNRQETDFQQKDVSMNDKNEIEQDILNENDRESKNKFKVESKVLRRSNRINKGIPPKRYGYSVNKVESTIQDSVTYDKTIIC